MHDNAVAQALCGQRDEHLRVLEELFPVRIFARGTELTVVGNAATVTQVIGVLNDLYAVSGRQAAVTVQEVRRAAALVQEGETMSLSDLKKDVIYMTPVGTPVTPRTLGQKQYVDAIKTHDIVFGIGPAGTGKTYLAMATAVAALKAKRVNRLILTRPAVEAGENLGFLPGDMQEKVDPYLRPLYDALYEMLGIDGYERAVERGIIEVAPLAYMRGRTLDNAFVILDEAQNTTPEQMKMFLTRLGFGSKMVITGDITQIDLPAGKRSGLVEARAVLQGVSGIQIVMLHDRDVVRHELVRRIINAYSEYAGHGPGQPPRRLPEQHKAAMPAPAHAPYADNRDDSLTTDTPEAYTDETSSSAAESAASPAVDTGDSDPWSPVQAV